MDQALPQTEQLYARHKKIHAREVTGRHSIRRKATALILLGIYYVLPWVTWEGRQAVLFDLPERKFYLFGFTFWPQDFLYLSMLLIMAALLLFFATALIGRVWCGYACPQTVWTQAFVWLERIAEGRYSKRIKLDKKGWTTEKTVRRTLKHVLWVSFALWTGFIFVGYFTPVSELAQKAISFELGSWETFWIGFYSFATYGNAGHMREQVCKYMCPYARFQSAMFDKDTLIVSYDRNRGEPRGSRKRGQDIDHKTIGDCIDCKICVQVCPTGIDIREGLQYECISCAACIDACNGVMDKMKYPRGLIRYTTQNALAGESSHILRPRILIYGALLAALFIGFMLSLAYRPMLQIDVIRDRNALYRELADDMIENVYTLKVLNKTQQPVPLRLTVSGIEGLVLDTDLTEFVAAEGSVNRITARVRANKAALRPGAQDIRFGVSRTDGPSETAEHDARFFAPAGTGDPND